MKKLLIFGIIILLFVSACNTLVCNKPYIQVGNECCLDENDNSICDKDEKQELSQTNPEVDTQTDDSSCVTLGCPSGTKYVGSINSNKFHYCNCQWAKEIHYNNINCFKSKEEAISRGYQACKVCNP